MLYIIGGGPGAGKTTIARELAQRFNLQYVKADDFAQDHQEKADKLKSPINYAINQLEDEERPLHLLELNSAHELARQTELFFMLLEEITARNIDGAIIEGNCLRPELVSKHVDFDHHAIWLIPTNGFLRHNSPQRTWLPDILKKSSDPDKTMSEWIERDIQHNTFVRDQAKLYDLPYIDVDGTQSIEHVTDQVVENFNLHT